MSFPTKNLGELCEFQGGSQPAKSNFVYEPTDGYVRFLQIRDFGSEKNHTYIPVNKKNKNCDSDDIMIGRYGASVGKILRGKSGAYNVALMKASPVTRLINKEFFWFYLNSYFFQNDLRKVASRSAQDGFSKDDIFNFQVPLPSLATQQKIVAKLDAIFVEINTATAAAEANAKNAEALFKNYSFRIFEEIKETWGEKSLIDICDVRDGTHDSPKYVEHGIPFVTQKNIRKNGLNLDDVKFITLEDHNKFYKRSNVAYEDILISMIGANRGMSAIVDNNTLFSIKNVCLVKKGVKANQNYLLYFFKSIHAQNYIKLFSNGGAQEFIGLTALRKFPIPIPPMEVQEKSLGMLNNIFSLCNLIENKSNEKVNLLVKLKNSILTKSFNGELVRE